MVVLREALRSWSRSFLLLPVPACALGGLLLAAASAQAAGEVVSEVRRHESTTIEVDVTFDAPEVRELTYHGETLADVTIPGTGRTEESGWPMVPEHVVLVGVPPTAEVRAVSAVPLVSERLDCAPILVTPNAVPDPEAPTGIGGFELRPAPGSEGGDVYPSSTAELREVIWWRNRRVAIVALRPVTTVPGRDGATVARSLRLRLDLAPGRIASARTAPARYGDDPLDAMLDARLVNGRESRDWLRSMPLERARRGAGAPDYFSRSTRWMKIETEGEGIVRVSGATLSSGGAALPITTPGTIRLFVADDPLLLSSEEPPDETAGSPPWMREVAIRVEDGGDGQLDATAGDRIEFLSKPVDGYLVDLGVDVAPEDSLAYHIHSHSDTRTYWLTWDAELSGTPLRVGVIDATPSGDPDLTVSEVTRRVHRERQGWYDPSVKYGDHRWEKWWWDEGTGRSDGTRVMRFDLDGHVAESAGRIDVRLWGRTPGQHLASLGWNGNPAPEVYSWSGRTEPYDVTVTWDDGEDFLVDGQNLISIRVEPEPVRTDHIYVAYLDLWHGYSLDWQGVDLDFRSPSLDGIVRYVVAGAPATAEIYDVTDPDRPIQLLGTLDGEVLSFDRTETSSTSRRYRVVDASSTRRSAVAVTRDTAPATTYLREHTGAVDYLVIHADAFAAAGEALAAIRGSVLHGVADPVAMAVNLSDVLDEFSWGLKDPTAIRNFVKYAFENYRDPGAPTSPRLRHVVLVGDASFDPRLYIVGADEDYLPAWVGRHELGLWYQGFTAAWPTDDYFGQLDGPTVFAPDVAIGRLPAQTSSQAQLLVGKVERHLNADPGEWHGRALMIADDICQGTELDVPFYFTHTRQAEEDILPVLPDAVEPVRVYLVDYPDPVLGLQCRGGDKPTARDAVIDAINQGVWLVDYVGHGGETVMADEKVLTSQDVPRMQNAGRYHYFVTASCSVGKFDEVNEGLGETVYKQPGGGAVVSFSAAAVAGSSSNVRLNRALLEALFAGGSTHPDSLRSFGEAVQVARMQPSVPGLNTTKYNILGDPATVMAWPDASVDLTLDVVDGSGVARGAPSDTLWRGDRMQIAGTVRNPDGTPATDVSGSVLVRVVDSAELRDRDPFEQQGQTITPVDYYLPGATIYRGEVAVDAGAFTADFVVPSGLRRGDRGPARLRCLVDTGDGQAFGSIDDVVVPDDPRPGWSSDDEEGPTITLDLGGPAEAVPVREDLRIELEDESGIYITQLLDSRSVLLTFEEAGGFVVSEVDLAPLITFQDGFQRAEVEVPYPTSLATGRPYTVRVRASDNLGNRSSFEEEIFLVSTGSPELRRVFAYPNPSDGRTVGLFVDVNVAVDVEAKVYTMTGRRIRTLEDTLAPGEGRSRPVEWDLRDEDGDRVANGTYFYVMEVTPTGGGEKETREGWIAVLR